MHSARYLHPAAMIAALSCRVLREMGHGFYIFWIMLNFGWIWTVGITRFTDYKHHMSDVLGGWFLGTAFGLIYCVRAAALHK